MEQDENSRRITRLESQYDAMSETVNNVMLIVKGTDVRSADFFASMEHYMNKHEREHDNLKTKDARHDREMEKMGKYMFGAYVALGVIGFIVSPIGREIFNAIFNQK